MGIVPPLVSYELEGLHVLNGYCVKGKNMSGTISTIPGQANGIRIEVDIRGIDPDTILTQKEFNLLTLSTNTNKFIRIGTPEGKTAHDIEIWPPIEGVIIMDAP
jgi:hypothetical protein